jgi:hypothetical protein
MMVVAAVRHPVVWFVTRVVHKKLLVKEKEIIKKHIKNIPVVQETDIVRVRLFGLFFRSLSTNLSL